MFCEKKTEVSLLASFLPFLPSMWVNRNFQVKSNEVGFLIFLFRNLQSKKITEQKMYRTDFEEKAKYHFLTHFQSFYPTI